MFNFPDSPTIGQQVIGPSGVAYTWDGVKWSTSLSGSSNLFLPLAGGSLSGPLLGTAMTASGNVGAAAFSTAGAAPVALADPPVGDSSKKLATTEWIDSALAVVAGRQNRNRLINGNFVNDQWNGAQAIQPASGDFVCDRWSFYATQPAKIETQASGSSLQINSISVFTPTATDLINISQAIEAINVVDFNWGLPQAQPATLSFSAYCTVAGTYAGSVQNFNGTRSYPFSFTLAANTWTRIVISIPGDTQGTWTPSSGLTSAAIYVVFALCAGSNFIGLANVWVETTNTTVASGNNFTQTGGTLVLVNIQFELGAQATPFDWRPYNLEFILCQRYYQANIWGGSGYAVANTQLSTISPLPVSMRTGPTVSYTFVSGNNIIAANPASDGQYISTILTPAADGMVSASGQYFLDAEM